MEIKRKRPLSVTLIGLLFVFAGAGGVAFHAGEFRTAGPIQYDLLGVTLVRVLAIVGGIYLLRGSSWARWLLIAWLAFHVVVSAFHSAGETIMHGVLLAAIALLLFRRSATAYLRGAGGASAAH
jgi:hypothetical protein